MTPILNWYSIAKTSVNKGCIGPYFNIGGLSFLSFRLNNYLAVNKCKLLLRLFTSFGRQEFVQLNEFIAKYNND